MLTVLLVWILCMESEAVDSRPTNVLMVLGGQAFNVTSREHDQISQVEVIGPRSSCLLSTSLPAPLYGLVAARLGDTVLACGGYYYYYRSECYTFSPGSGQWRQTTSLERPTAFPAGVAAEGDFYIGGGRSWVWGKPANESFEYYDTVRVLHGSLFTSELPPLPYPLADACMVITTVPEGKRRLWLLGGSNYPGRFMSEVFTLDLISPSSGWTKMHYSLPDARRWAACSTTIIQGEQGILVTGGYYNGASSMWLPLVDRFGTSLEKFGPNRNEQRWEYLSSLDKERKWLPAIGYIGDQLALAGGGDYGDNTVSVLQGRDWISSSVTMHYKREFAAGVTVPSDWFPQCAF